MKLMSFTLLSVFLLTAVFACAQQPTPPPQKKTIIAYPTHSRVSNEWDVEVGPYLEGHKSAALMAVRIGGLC